MSMAAELTMTNAFIKQVKDHGSVNLNSSNPLDIALSIWIDSKKKALKGTSSKDNRVSNILPPECLKILQENQLVEVFRETVQPDLHLEAAKSFVNFVRSRNVDAPLKLKPDEWQYPRNWYYAQLVIKVTNEARDKAAPVFAEAGWHGLENAKLNSHELRQLVYADQVIRWFQVNKKLPQVSGRSNTEKAMAEFLKNVTNPFVLNFLKRNGISNNNHVPAPAPEPQHPRSNVVVDLSDVNQRIDRIEAMLEKLLDLLEKTKVKKPRKWVPQFPLESYEKYIPESKLVGLATLELEKGKTITVGVQNVMLYPSGSKKYILRMPVSDGTYGKVFYRWSSDQGLKEVTMMQ